MILSRLQSAGRKDPKAVSRRKTVKTSARGVIEDAPLEYASLMGKAKKKETS